MSDFPTANFSGTDDGLFTVAEIRRLMAAEFDRSLRYRYPVAFLTLRVDRLSQLQDLYGFEAKATILQSVTHLLQTVSRASDFLGCLEDDRVLALFPYTSAEGIAAIAKRLLTGARNLRFDGDGHTLRVTLTIGAAHHALASQAGYGDLLRTAEQALELGQAAGGDRFVLREGRLAVEGAVPSLAGAPERGRPAPFPDDAEFFDRIREYLVLHGQTPQGAPQIDREMLTALLRSLEEERDGSLAGQTHQQGKQIELLERRISKLSSMLEGTERALRMMARGQPVDAGVASIYKTVQGLGDDEDNLERKKEMMAQIFQANLDLKGRSGR